MTENGVERAEEKKRGFAAALGGIKLQAMRMNGRTRQILLAVALLVAGGVIALTGQRLIAGGSSEDNELRVTSYKDWRMICPPMGTENGRCAISVEVVQDGGGTIVALSMDNPEPSGPLSVTVPLGVLLDPGLGFSAGNDPLRVRPYETCTPAGCVAFITVDADTRKSLEGNTSGQVVVVPGNGSPVTIPFSLQGFAEGYSALQRENSRRTSMWSFLYR
jgi:invasion protein IalB